jgi:hypothetical protein
LDNIYLCYEAAVVPIECDISETHEIATTLTFLDSGSCSLTIDDLEQDSALVAKVTSSPIQTSVALLHDAWWEDIRETNDQSARQKVARLQYCLDCGSRLVRETTLAHFCQDRGLGGKGCQERYAKFIKRSKANWKKMQTLRTSNHPAWTDEQKKLNRTINKRLAEIRIRVHTGKIRDNSKDVQDWT